MSLPGGDELYAPSHSNCETDKCYLIRSGVPPHLKRNGHGAIFPIRNLQRKYSTFDNLFVKENGVELYLNQTVQFRSPIMIVQYFFLSREQTHENNMESNEHYLHKSIISQFQAGKVIFSHSVGTRKTQSK